MIEEVSNITEPGFGTEVLGDEVEMSRFRGWMFGSDAEA